jgi:lysophospholipase L1-like esterase
MKIGWTKAACLVGLLGGMTASAVAQGDPQRAFDPATAAVRRPGTKVRIDLIGDSTQTDHAGYGRGFCANMTAEVDCVNMARGGASTQSFRMQGLWEKSLQTKPDYMLIQFGHNDVVIPARPGPDPNAMPTDGGRAVNGSADYEKNLRQYVTEARAAGIKPVLITPLTRQYFEADGKIHSDQTEHSETMRRVAKEMNVPLIELQNDSIAYLEKAGEQAGHKYEITKKDATGATIYDKTHLNWAGSYVFGRMVAEGLGKAVPELAKYVSPKAAELPPEGVKMMSIIEGAPAKIVLVGDSTVATEGGWGPAFCADFNKKIDCVDVALNGRSTKSFIDEGAWKKALELKGDYYLIQFGHNDQKPDAARHTDADGSFQQYLHRYVADVKAIGGVPILVTSLSRRNYKDGKLVEDLNDYASATRKVAEEEYITLIDLNQMSTALLRKMTQEQADRFNATTHPDEAAENPGAAGDGKATLPDRTHLNDEGKKVFGRMVADAIVKTRVELGPGLIGVPTPGAAAPDKNAPPTTPYLRK